MSYCRKDSYPQVHFIEIKKHLFFSMLCCLSGTYTLLAPPDSAITSKGYTWPRLLMDRAKGRDLMRRHTILGALYTEGLLQRRTIRTLAGTSVTFRRDIDGRAPARDLLAFGSRS